MISLLKFRIIQIHDLCDLFFFHSNGGVVLHEFAFGFGLKVQVMILFLKFFSLTLQSAAHFFELG
jgi:hypothetical protein